MADFEDATTPTWDNLIEGQMNLMDAVRRTIRFEAPEAKKSYQLVAKPATHRLRTAFRRLIDPDFVDQHALPSAHGQLVRTRCLAGNDRSPQRKLSNTN